MGHNFDYCGVSGCKVCGQPPCDSCKVLEDVAERLDKKLGEEYIKTMSLRARIEDVEALTDKLFANFYPATLSRCHVVAEYLSKWLKEGK
jgi:hypothetical protein